MEIPVVLIGESPVLKLKGNVLMQELHALTVECLPSKIPTSVASENSMNRILISLFHATLHSVPGRVIIDT